MEAMRYRIRDRPELTVQELSRTKRSSQIRRLVAASEGQQLWRFERPEADLAVAEENA